LKKEQAQNAQLIPAAENRISVAHDLEAFKKRLDGARENPISPTEDVYNDALFATGYLVDRADNGLKRADETARQVWIERRNAGNPDSTGGDHRLMVLTQAVKTLEAHMSNERDRLQIQDNINSLNNELIDLQLLIREMGIRMIPTDGFREMNDRLMKEKEKLEYMLAHLVYPTQIVEYLKELQDQIDNAYKKVQAVEAPQEVQATHRQTRLAEVERALPSTRDPAEVAKLVQERADLKKEQADADFVNILNLKKGSRGPAVSALITYLQKLGYTVQPSHDSETDSITAKLEALKMNLGGVDRKADESVEGALHDFMEVEDRKDNADHLSRPVKNTDTFSPAVLNRVLNAVHRYYDLEAQITLNPKDDKLTAKRDEMRKKINEVQNEKRHTNPVLTFCEKAWSWITWPFKWVWHKIHKESKAPEPRPAETRHQDLQTQIDKANAKIKIATSQERLDAIKARDALQEQLNIEEEKRLDQQSE